MATRRDDGPPIGALPEVEHTGDTDPDPFRSSEDTTKRRCSNCGAEIGPDEAATLRGEIAVYEKLYAYLVARNVSPVAAARTIEDIRKSPQ